MRREWLKAVVGLVMGMSGMLSGSGMAAQPAEGYPAKTVRIVIPFGPGSITDTLARFVSQELQASVGGSFVVEQRPGASGIIASQLLQRAAPDGYTLFIGTNTTNAANLALFKSIPYDPIRDFTPIGRLTAGQQVLCVHPAIPAKNVKELMELARRRPQDFSYATSNSTSLISAELLNHLSGTKMLQVPFKNSTDTYTEVVAGRITMVFGDHLNTVPLIKAGRMKALAVTGVARSKLLPDVPTLTEAGFPGSLNNWAGLYGPAGLPESIVNRLSDATLQLLQKPEMIARLQEIGYAAYPAGAREFAKFNVDEVGRWRDAIAMAKIQPE